VVTREGNVSRGRTRIVLAVGLWTGLLLAAAIVIVGEAMASLYSGEQACFFRFPEVACPRGDDPAVVRLTFAFFGVPAIWLLGIVVAVIALAVRRGRLGQR
jgi:hypothetical protein